MFTKKSMLIILFILTLNGSGYTHVPSTELEILRTEIVELRATIVNLQIELTRIKSRVRKTKKVREQEKLELIRTRRVGKIQRADARATLQGIRISRKERLRDLRRSRTATYPSRFGSGSTRRSTTVSVRR